MNPFFYLNEIKRQLGGFIAWFICLGLLLTVFLVNYSSLSAVTMETLLGIDFSMFSDELLENLQLHILPDLSEYVEYFAFFVQLITAASCFYATYLGVTAISEDIGDGVAEFLTAQPVSRINLLLHKLASRATLLFAFNMLLCILTLVLSGFSAPEGSVYVGGVISVFLSAFLSQLIFLIIGFCVSCFWSSAAQSSSFSMALVFFSILLGTAAPIFKETTWLRGLSPYHFSAPMDVIKQGYAFPLGGWLMLILGGGGFLALSFLYFRRRDISVRG